ncbi:MAG: reverse transcriptase domain-containing protein [Clostridia bacterium]
MTNNNYYVDMKQRFIDFKENKYNMRLLHPMVYESNNVALAIRQLSKSKGRMAKGQDGTSYKTLENYSIDELSEIVKDRLLNKKMDYVKRTYIPKSNGKMRPLGICSIWDKLVEKCIQLVIEPYCETKFVSSSFGFREQVSTHNALAKVKNQCKTMPFVLSVDLENYFGTINADIAYREMWYIGIKDQIILNYIFRYIKKGYYENSIKVEEPLGTAQGSILGPVISNIYLHRFDVWLREQSDDWHDKNISKFHNNHRRRNMRLTNLKIGIHVRYADDILVLCDNIEDAQKFEYSIRKYLTQTMKLKVNSDKTKIYDLRKETMKYLGYVFYACPNLDIKSVTQKGTLRVKNILHKDKEDEIVKKCCRLLNDIKKKTTFKTIQAWNTYVIGLHNYYKGMTHFYKCFTKIGWRICRKFYHTMHKKVKFIKDETYKNNFMNGTYSSWGKKGYFCFSSFPVIEIWWANWDKDLIRGQKGKVSRVNPYDYKEKSHKTGVSFEDIKYLTETSRNIKSSRFAMFRVSKYSCTKGASYMTGLKVPVEEYHCHHIVPKYKGGTNDFDNLCVLSSAEHRMLHSKNAEILYEIYPKRKERIRKLIENL